MKNGETYNNGKGNRTNKTIRNAKRHKYNLVNSLFHIIDRLFKRIVPVQAKKLQTSRICMLDTNSERLSNCNLIRCNGLLKVGTAPERSSSEKTVGVSGTLRSNWSNSFVHGHPGAPTGQ